MPQADAPLFPWPGSLRMTETDVAASQHARLLWATAHAVAEKGYAQTIVADIIRLAGVSRKTFYVHFADKEACFLAAYDAGREVMLATIADALGDADDAYDQLERLVRTYLRILSAEPAWARTYLVEVYAAGPAALARRRAAGESFRELLRHIHERFVAEGSAGRVPTDLELEALVGGVSAIVTVRIADGDGAALPALGPPLLAHLLRTLAPGRGPR